MKQTKHMKLVLLLALVFVIVLSACSSNKEGNNNEKAGETNNSSAASTASNNGEKPSVKNVEFWYSIAGANGEVVKSIVENYNNSQDQYKVEAIFIPPAERLKQLTVAIASGETPDLYTAGPPDVAALTSSSQVLSIDELASKNDTKITRDMFFKPLQDIVVRDDTLYGVPISTGATALYYNEDLFKEAGLTRAPQTWDEFIEYAQKLTDPAKGQWGVLLPTKEMDYTARMWVTFLEQAGGNLLNEDATKATFNSDAGVEALQLWVDLFHKYKVAPLKLMDENTIVQTFGAGNAGMFFGYPIWTVQAKDFPFTTQTARPIKQVRSSSALGGWYLVVPSLGKNPDGAYDFLAWLSQPDNAVQWNLGMGNLPTTQAATDTKAYQDFLEENPLVKPFSVTLAEDAIAPSATGKFSQVLAPVTKAIAHAIYQNKTPKEALDEAAAEVDAILAED